MIIQSVSAKLNEIKYRNESMIIALSKVFRQSRFRRREAKRLLINRTDCQKMKADCQQASRCGVEKFEFRFFSQTERGDGNGLHYRSIRIVEEDFSNTQKCLDLITFLDFQSERSPELKA